MEPVQKLRNRVAIVTGGAGGIGAACTRLLADHGARVVVADVNRAAATGLVASMSGDHLAVEADVGDEGSARELVASTVERFGRLDILVNNAADLILAGTKDTDVESLEPAVWEATMGTLLRGAFLCTKFSIPHLLAAPGGSIVNVSSIVAMFGDVRYTAYATAKSGLLAFTRSVATQYGRRGLRCNAICPGQIASDRMTGETLASLLRHQLLARHGQPADIASAVLFLASDDSGFITGQNLVVDGGMTVPMPTFADHSEPAG